MHGQNTIFLTPQEAVAAIRRDLQQYEPQTRLLSELFPVVMGAGAVAVKDANPGRIWITRSARGPMRQVTCSELADILSDQIAKETVTPERLADFCASVFKSSAAAGFDSQTQTPGIWVDTGMGGYACRQCGQCCRTLDYHHECTAEDYSRWQTLGREDILQWVRCIPGSAGRTAYRIWVAPGTTEPVDECPFLANGPAAGQVFCTIHAIKPGICRQYPYTRKHAVKTGCRGFDRN